MKFAPLRPLTDFVGNSARFSVPNQSKLGDRLVSNLLFYQSNYFLVFSVILIMLG